MSIPTIIYYIVLVRELMVVYYSMIALVAMVEHAKLEKSIPSGCAEICLMNVRKLVGLMHHCLQQ